MTKQEQIIGLEIQILSDEQKLNLKTTVVKELSKALTDYIESDYTSYDLVKKCAGKLQDTLEQIKDLESELQYLNNQYKALEK